MRARHPSEIDERARRCQSFVDQDEQVRSTPHWHRPGVREVADGVGERVG
jgi:hypothetical protein